MAVPKFKVGDYISYETYNSKKSFKGKILKVNKNTQNYEILFGEDFTSFYAVPALYIGFHFDTDKITKSKSEEETIQDKCKLLWNKSKYVQKNPEQGYTI